MEPDTNRWDITVETEKGEFVDSPRVYFRDFMSAINRWMPEDDLTKTRCLQYIDPWGDTTFNALQKGVLLKELESIVSNSESAKAREFFQPIIECLFKYKDEVGTYVKFYGD
jgi:hypothetical protein